MKLLDIDEAWDKLLDELAKNLKPAGTVEAKTKKSIELTVGSDKHPGRVFEALSSDKKAALHAKLFQVKDKLYEISVNGAPAAVKAKEATAVLDSFALYDPSKEKTTTKTDSKEAAFEPFESKDGGFKVSGPGKSKEDESTGTVTFGDKNKYTVAYQDEDDAKKAEAAAADMIQEDPGPRPLPSPPPTRSTRARRSTTRRKPTTSRSASSSSSRASSV